MLKVIERTIRSRRPAAAALVAVVLMATGIAPAAQEAYRLVSAQVVTSTDRPPALKLSANGPIAFHVLTPAESGQPADAAQVKARLYGIAPGDLATASGLSPFILSASADGHDSIIVVRSTSGAILEMKAGGRANEVVIVSR